MQSWGHDFGWAWVLGLVGWLGLATFCWVFLGFRLDRSGVFLWGSSLHIVSFIVPFVIDINVFGPGGG